MRRAPDIVGRPWSAIANHPFEACTAVGGIVSMTWGFINPGALDKTSLAHVAYGTIPIWQGMYLLASILILWGLLRSIRVEAAGLCLMIAAVTIEAISVIHYRGPAGIVVASAFLGLGWGSLIRLRVLFWLTREIEREQGE